MTREVASPTRTLAMPITILGLCALAAWVAVRTVDVGQDAGHYAYGRMPADPMPGVITSIGIMLAEIAVAAAIAFGMRTTKPALRTLAITLGFGLVFFAGLPFGMHAPPSYASHLIWTLFAAGWSLVMTLVASIETAWRTS